jgi:ComF family protein
MNFLSIWHDFVDLIFPRCCEACDRGLVGNEQIICTSCRISLPRVTTDSILTETLMDKFAHIPEVKGAASFLLFSKKGKVQKLLHALKYKGRDEIGTELGFMFGQEIRNSLEFPDADLIISIPLHKKRIEKRGYNQSDKLAEGFSKATQIPWSGSVLERIRNTDSQTGKTKKERRENVRDVFVVKQTPINKRIIILDDVLTTGATAEACVDALTSVGCETCYIFTIAAAHH